MAVNSSDCAWIDVLYTRDGRTWVIDVGNVFYENIYVAGASRSIRWYSALLACVYERQPGNPFTLRLPVYRRVVNIWE